jgi:hypothetical protein
VSVMSKQSDETTMLEATKPALRSISILCQLAVRDSVTHRLAIGRDGLPWRCLHS